MLSIWLPGKDEPVELAGQSDARRQSRLPFLERLRQPGQDCGRIVDL